MKTITFTSDFGTSDWFTAAVKGEIIKIAGDVRIVDITHDITPFDIRGAAFLLHTVYGNFPKGTIHLCVIDPGVGGKRKPLIVDSLGHYFVGPDNGLFSYVYKPESEVYTIDVGEAASQTFHARDIFGPVAARLATGVPPEKLGKRLFDYEHFEIPQVSRKKGRLQGEIAYIDHFGNCITNIQNHEEISEISVARRRIYVKNSYSVAQGDEVISVRGSSGFYEIAAYRGSARNIMHAKVGMSIEAS